MSNVVPNSFQTPNAYVDRAMAHLSHAELRVLIFATRHILGWQDKIASRQGQISLTMFERGFVVRREDGTETRYGGCGLTRAAILAACVSLDRFRLLEKVGEPTADGQLYRLGDAPDWEALEQRSRERAAHNTRRTAKAAAQSKANRLAGTSHVPSTSDVPATGTSHVPEGGTSDVLNQTHDQTHDQTQSSSNGAAAEQARPNVYVWYEQAIGPLTQMLGETLREAEAEYPAQWLEDAFKEAAANNGRSWRYVEKILQRWRRDGKPTPEPAAASRSTAKSAASLTSPGVPELGG